MAFSLPADVRNLLPNIPDTTTQNALVEASIGAGDAEIVSRLSPYINVFKAHSLGAPVIKQISTYLGASIFLTTTLSFNEANDETTLSQYYRSLAERLMNIIVNTGLVMDADGAPIDAEPVVPAKQGGWTGFYDGDFEEEGGTEA